MSCRGCIYRGTISGGNLHTCDYILITGHSRGCPVEGCTKRETKGQAKRRRDRPVNLPGSLPLNKHSNWTPHRTREDKPGPRLSFDERKAVELYSAGKIDREIGEAVGVPDYCIRNWRFRRGLPCQAERKKAACEEAQTTRT